MKNSLFQFVFFICFAFHGVGVLAAACCGGGVSVASLITTDDKAQVSALLSQSKVDTDVFSNGVWQKRKTQDETQVLRLEASQIFEDRFQYGLSVPLQNRQREANSSGAYSGLGDVSAQLGYEYLPDWDYNPLRPRGIGFLALTLPTGKSIYESSDGSGADSQGRGFWALGIGTVLTKFWGRYDASLVAELHKSFEKKVESAQFQGVVRPNLGESLGFNFGVSFKKFRGGLGLIFVHEESIAVQGSVNSDGSPQESATGSISVGYELADSMVTNISFSDQTLFGSPTNTTLSRAILVSFTKKWAR